MPEKCAPEMFFNWVGLEQCAAKSLHSYVKKVKYVHSVYILFFVSILDLLTEFLSQSNLENI